MGNNSGRSMTAANRELHTVMKAAKPKGKPKINRSAPDKRTWNGVKYDSKAEMEFHQAFPHAFRCNKGPDSMDLGALGLYTPDFWIHPATLIEVKGTRYTKVKRQPRPWWSDRGKLKFLRAQEFTQDFREDELILAIKHNGVWIDGQTGEILPGGTSSNERQERNGH